MSFQLGKTFKLLGAIRAKNRKNILSPSSTELIDGGSPNFV
jgi:hypothetical protein